jgi:hypothetical protein
MSEGPDFDVVRDPQLDEACDVSADQFFVDCVL